MMGEVPRVVVVGEWVVEMDVKQVVLFRRDLKMRKGKIAAQCAHASMKVFFDRAVAAEDRGSVTIALTPEMAAWVFGRFTKIVLSVEDEAALLLAQREAEARGLPCALILDSGRTEFHGQPTHTALAIGPAPSAEIDVVTGPRGLVAVELA